MVSASLLRRQHDPCSICSASGRPLRTMSDHQTLRVCNEIVRDPFGHPCCATCRLTKRYVCAASAFPAVETSRDSSVWTRRGPRNTTHVMAFACPHGFHETLHTQWFRSMRSTWLGLCFSNSCCGHRLVDIGWRNVAVANVSLTSA